MGGVLLVMLVSGAIIAGIFIFFLAVFIVGKKLDKNPRHKKLALALRLISYFVIVPIIFSVILFYVFLRH